MDIGIALLMTRHDFNTINLARRVEELGFESLWAPETSRSIRPPDGKEGCPSSTPRAASII